MIDTAQFLWIGDRLSTIERLALSSFVSNCYRVDLYVYGDIQGVPSGVNICDAAQIVPQCEVFASPGVKGLSYASFSDYFRYVLLLKKGGWWFDLDMVCYRRLPPPRNFLVASTWEGSYGQCASNCAIWAEPSDGRIAWLVDQCRMILHSGKPVEFCSLGPFLIQKLIADYSLSECVAPWYEFCPFPWRTIKRLALRTNRDVLADSLRDIKYRCLELVDSDFKAGHIRRGTRAIHLHNEIWALDGLGKDESYHPLSVIENLKRRYLEGVAS